MKFLGQEIPDAPADCDKGKTCEEFVPHLKLTAAYMIATVEAMMPDAPGEELKPSTEGAIRRVASALTDLPAVAERDFPAAQRCGGCIVTCAVKVLQEGAL